MIILNSIIFWISFSICFNEIVSERNHFLKSENDKTANDLPSHTDFHFYLSSLVRIINFSYEFKDELDLSFSFGLFLVNVHLKPFLNDHSLPNNLRNYLKKVLDRNDKIIAFLNNEQDYTDGDDTNLKISTFFKNATTWSKRMKKLNSKTQKRRYKIYGNTQVYPEWSNYVNYVNDIDNWVPTPQHSDDCLASLAENEDRPISLKCRVPKKCYSMLITGSNFGYALTHRLLFLLFAHFGRQCDIFSKSQDEMMRHRFCETIYNEAEYIASNRFLYVDLMLEQIALCVLNGHTDFLHSSWLTKLLRYQSPYGCFASHNISFHQFSIFEQHFRNKPRNNEEKNWKKDIVHVTAVAAASIAAALRYILESY